MSTHQLYFHLVWTTRDRLPVIDAATRAFLEEFFKKTAARQDAEIVGLSIIQTHVHVLVRTPPRFDLPRLVQFFKGGSSYAASRQPGNILGLRWGPEYSATTVGPRQLRAAIGYLEDQAEHHPGEGIEKPPRSVKTTG